MTELRKSPACYYIEVSGQMHGPYAADSILRLISSGQIPFSQKIYNSETNAWLAASEITPEPNAQPVTPTANAWAPPPRPEVLKDVHVVDYDPELTNNIDYFALVGSLNNNSAKASAPASQKKEVKRDNVYNTLSQGTVNKPNFLDDLQNASGAFSQASGFFKNYQKQFGYVASLTLIGFGVYGFYNNYTEKRRDLASAKKEVSAAVVTAPVTPAPRSAEAQAPMKMSSPSAIGSGRNPVMHHSGGVNTQASPHVNANDNLNGNNPPEVVPYQQPADQNAGSPQFFSTSDDSNREIASPPPAPMPGNMDPASGAVQPSGFMNDPAALTPPPAVPDPNNPGGAF